MGMHVIIIVMKIHDLKNKDYTAYIFDMDGTLYYQRPLRMRMFLCMAGFYLTHPLRWKEPFMVRDYRKLRENEALLKKENWKDLIRDTLSDKYHVEKSRLQETINFWMQEKPLEYIKNYQDKTLKHFIEQLQASGKKIIIYSDYPAGKKGCFPWNKRCPDLRSGGKPDPFSEAGSAGAPADPEGKPPGKRTIAYDRRPI